MKRNEKSKEHWKADENESLTHLKKKVTGF